MRLLILSAALCFTGNSMAQNQAPSAAVLSANGGRFVMGQLSSFRADQYLLDTQTGRVWRVACLKGADVTVNCEVIGLVPALFVDTNGHTMGPSPGPMPGAR